MLFVYLYRMEILGVWDIRDKRLGGKKVGGQKGWVAK